MQLDLVYFAWVRERIGVSKEAVETDAETVRALIAELSVQNEKYAFAFSDMSAVKIAVDQQLSDLDHKLAGAREVAIFPPMTGG